MERAFTKLPLELQKSLERWYLISCSAFSILLLSMAAIHVWVTFSPTHVLAVPQVASEPIIAQESEDSLFQKQCAAFDAFTHEQQLVPHLFEQCMNRLPETVYLTHCTMTAQKKIECSGAGSNLTSIAELVAALHACGLACTTVSTEHRLEKAYPLAFHIEAQACLSAQ